MSAAIVIVVVDPRIHRLQLRARSRSDPTDARGLEGEAGRGQAAHGDRQQGPGHDPVDRADRHGHERHQHQVPGAVPARPARRLRRLRGREDLLHQPDPDAPGRRRVAVLVRPDRIPRSSGSASPTWPIRRRSRSSPTSASRIRSPGIAAVTGRRADPPGGCGDAEDDDRLDDLERLGDLRSRGCSPTTSSSPRSAGSWARRSAGSDRQAQGPQIGAEPAAVVNWSAWSPAARAPSTLRSQSSMKTVRSRSRPLRSTSRS